MGTRADFYIGRGQTAEWIGSKGFDGYPNGMPIDLICAVTEQQFRDSLETFQRKDDWTDPSQGWPWPWETSHTTDCIYAFDAETVWFCWFGAEWTELSEYLSLSDKAIEELDLPKQPKDAFPDMSERQNVTFGQRSGALFLSLPRLPACRPR